MDEVKERKINIFYSYAREDEKLRKRLEKHLSVLKYSGVIDDWSDHNISAGSEWAREINEKLTHAHIILLLVSPNFMASDYCYSIEMKYAMEKHERDEAIVIPILLQPVSWENAPFGKMQAFPSNTRPVTKWRNYDDAFVNITQGIQEAIVKIVNKGENKQKISIEDINKRSAQEVAKRLAGKHILVVEDNSAITLLFRTIFQLLGCEINSTDNGKEAISYINEHQPDLILLDINMPYIGGLEVVKHLRGIGNNTPILIISAATEHYLVEGLKLGASACLQKPFHLATLYQYMILLLYNDFTEVTILDDTLIE